MRKIENHKATFLENLIKASFVCYFFSFKISSKIQEYLIPGFFPYVYIDIYHHFTFNWGHNSAYFSYYIHFLLIKYSKAI